MPYMRNIRKQMQVEFKDTDKKLLFEQKLQAKANELGIWRNSDLIKHLIGFDLNKVTSGAKQMCKK